MNNAVMMMVYNQAPAQLELTKSAVASVLEQDVPVDLFIHDNGSTDETWQWIKSIREPSVCKSRSLVNQSPVQVANWWMNELFNRLKYQHILGVPNDVVLPPNLLREFLRWPRGIVTGSMTPEKNFTRFEESHAQNTCTPMAVALIRKWAWQALVAKDGYFLDPRYFHYASDCDFALRLAACGITGVQLDLQYWHFGSASHRLADWETAETICSQADDDRRAFEQKWGITVDSPEYSSLAGDINFRG